MNSARARLASGEAHAAPAAMRSIVRVLPGDFHVTDDPAITIVTVLGSCVAACIRDPLSGFGGLNHFMLPEGESDDWNGVSAALRYGNYAMEALINAVLKTGCPRERLEAKLFGGASMYGSVNDVGRKNAAFARHYLETERIALLAGDLGGEFGRRIEYRPATGKVQRLVLRDREAETIRLEEGSYKARVAQQPVSGEIDLFD